MISDHTAQVYKAGFYASEPHRFRMATPDTCVMIGWHHDHTLRKNGRGWECSCAYFRLTAKVYHACAHTIALERVLGWQAAASTDSPTEPG